MKHTKKTALTAALLTAAVSMAAGVTLTSCYPQMVYGPPEDNYEPASEEPQDVYGPPVAYDDETKPAETTTAKPAETTSAEIKPAETTAAGTSVPEDTTTTTVEQNFQVVYGPPADFK